MQWCQCNRTDDAKIIERIKQHGPLQQHEFKAFVAGFYKECRSGCKRPCIANVQAAVQKHAASMEAA